MTSTAIVSLPGALAAALGRHLPHLPEGLTLGVFTDSLTAAPALDAATCVTGDPQATVDYAPNYPIDVIVGILAVTTTVTRKWVGVKDTPSPASKSLETLTVQVTETINTRRVRVWRGQRVRMSYLRRDDITRVVVSGEDLEEGDLIFLVGDPENIEEAASQVGVAVDHYLEDDRPDVAFERIAISNLNVAGRSISALNVSARFDAVTARVRRGSLGLFARDNLDLQLGDHVAVVIPIGELEDIQNWLGDSERRVSEISTMTFDIGTMLGMLLGVLPSSIPGGATFELGPATGPLIVRMFLGALRRTGPLARSFSTSVSLTIR